MERLVLALGSLLLSALIIGCGGGGTTSGTVIGPAQTVPDSENPNLPAEVREQAKKEEEQSRKIREAQSKAAKP